VPFFLTGFSLIIDINNNIISCVWAPYLDKFRRHFPSGAHYGLTRKAKNSIQKLIFKSKRSRSWCVEMSDLSYDTKKHTTKSRETIPLIEQGALQTVNKSFIMCQCCRSGLNDIETFFPDFTVLVLSCLHCTYILLQFGLNCNVKWHTLH
jgi:hypothetical protein